MFQRIPSHEGRMYGRIKLKGQNVLFGPLLTPSPEASFPLPPPVPLCSVYLHMKWPSIAGGKWSINRGHLKVNPSQIKSVPSNQQPRNTSHWRSNDIVHIYPTSTPDGLHMADFVFEPRPRGLEAWTHQHFKQKLFHSKSISVSHLKWVNLH